VRQHDEAILRLKIPEFRIPDFPLGALLATILLSVGALLAFPDMPLGFVWEIVAIISMIVWALGAGFLRGSEPSEPNITQEGQSKTVQGPPTADFAALTNAINAQGRANRIEERREDIRRQFIDLTTIILLALTAAAIFRQLDEMVKVYGPIKEQAEAAKAAATAANDNIIAGNRAWIVPGNVSIQQMVAGARVDAVVNYTNAGHQPAKLERGLLFRTFTKTDWWSSPSGFVLRSLSNACMSKQDFTPTSIVYPSTAYQLSTVTNASGAIYADSTLLNGDTVLAITGCFIYSTFEKIHHTSFCYYFQKISTPDIGRLTVCEAGNDAD
jgi:hypothetical protein